MEPQSPSERVALRRANRRGNATFPKPETLSQRSHFVNNSTGITPTSAAPRGPPFPPALSACAKAFQHHEIVRAILQHVSFRQRFALLRINTVFHDLIMLSIPFQKKMLLDWPAPTYAPYQQILLFYRDFWRFMKVPLRPYECRVIAHEKEQTFEFRFGINAEALHDYVHPDRKPDSMEMDREASSWRWIHITTYPYPLRFSFYGLNFQNGYLPGVKSKMYHQRAIRLGELVEELERFMIYSMALTRWKPFDLSPWAADYLDSLRYPLVPF